MKNWHLRLLSVRRHTILPRDIFRDEETNCKARVTLVMQNILSFVQVLTWMHGIAGLHSSLFRFHKLLYVFVLPVITPNL